MKKFLLILCSVFLFTGCSEKTESTSEIVPENTTELPTEEVTETTESNVYAMQTYNDVLYNMYYNCEFPDWDYKNYDKDISIDFAVYDIDSDGREELLVTFDNRSIFMYDHNADGNLVEQFSGYIQSDFYENGAVKVYSAHNQTHSFEVHPFQMYKYNAETDSYDLCGSVRGIDKDVVDMINKEKEEVGRTDFLEYPSEYDTSSSGTVYYIRRSDDDIEIPMSETEYNEYYEQFTENTDIIDIPFMKLTEKNIKKVSGNSLNVTEISDNIKLYDLTQSENSDYLKYLTEFSYGNEYEMSGGKISEENRNIYFENLSGERKALIELPVESETVYVVISCIIDDKRFAYNIIQEDASLGCGVYNLLNNEDFRIESEKRCHYFTQKVSGDYLILTRGFIADFYGYSKLNLKTFELTNIDSKYISQEQRSPKVAFSQDGKTAAVFSGKNENGEYIITLFSLDDDTKTAEYKFSSENEYMSFNLEFVSKYELYVYACKKDGSNYLYAIDIPHIPELNDWQKSYKQALFDFMDSDEYFSGSDIIEHSAFSIYDLNTDGIPELIISEDTSHAAACRIYTYDNGLIYLDRMGAYGDIGYYEDNGMIVHYNLGQGIEHEIFNRLENNQINIIAKFYNDLGYRGKEQAVFKFNDAEITRDEYNTKLAEYRGTEYLSLGRDYSFDEIDTALTEYSRIISVSRAAELLWNGLEKYDNRHISYYNRQKFDDRTYYVFRSYEDYDDRRVTTGWYAVDIFTGDCYNTNVLTELTPLINEEKKFSYKITESGGVEIYSDGKFYQSLDVTINDTFLDLESKGLLMFRDYDFDGYNDIAVTKALATNMVCSYFRYNPDTEYFESWSELDNLYFYITINDNKTLSVHAKSSAVDADDTVYKWSGDVLVPVSKEKRYSKGRDIFIDYLEYDDYGNETLVKREKYIFDKNGDVTGTVDVTP